MNIILASGSPRRHELLATAGVEFSVLRVDINESVHSGESPTDYIERMVDTKAAAAIEQLSMDMSQDDSCLILTADTIGVLPDGKTVLIKPEDRAHAYQMWQQMSDATHEVWTAVQVTRVQRLSDNHENDENNKNEADKTALLKVVSQKRIVERTAVSFVPLTLDMMSAYWDSGEPIDKAGGYAIQGGAAAWVTRINGSYTNVVGLPLAQILALIKECV